MLLSCFLLVAPPSASAQVPHAPVVDLTFPTVAGARFEDDYALLRGAGRAHRATDLFAAAGAPVFAAVGGTVSWLPGRHHSAGYAIHIRGVDGRMYAYYHLGPDGGPRDRAYAPGLTEGQAVARGQLIGYLGDSGNAVGTRPHLHFEIHQDGVTDPYGTNRLNPYPSLVAAVARGDFAFRIDGSTSRSARTGVLRAGDVGPAVAEWQGLLNQTRSSPIAVDGSFGPQTEAATREFQAARGLDVDGVVGPKTRGAMATVAGAGVLRFGDTGPAVAAWQSQLNQTRSSPIAVDGSFGPQTAAATREFQAARGLVVDGVVGPQTRAAIAA